MAVLKGGMLFYNIIYNIYKIINVFNYMTRKKKKKKKNYMTNNFYNMFLKNRAVFNNTKERES